MLKKIFIRLTQRSFNIGKADGYQDLYFIGSYIPLWLRLSFVLIVISSLTAFYYSHNINQKELLKQQYKNLQQQLTKLRIKTVEHPKTITNLVPTQNNLLKGLLHLKIQIKEWHNSSEETRFLILLNKDKIPKVLNFLRYFKAQHLLWQFYSKQKVGLNATILWRQTIK